MKKGCMYEWRCFKYLDGGQYFSGWKKFLHSGLMVRKRRKKIVYHLKMSEYLVYSDFTNDWGRQSPAFLIEIYFMLKFANAWPFLDNISHFRISVHSCENMEIAELRASPCSQIKAMVEGNRHQKARGYNVS